MMQTHRIGRRMFERSIGKPLESRKSFFLFGPRDTGKTTWLKHRLPEALFVNLLQSEFYNRLTANPGHLRQLVPPGHTGWTIIDEVQRIPALLILAHPKRPGGRLRPVRAKRLAGHRGRAFDSDPIQGHKVAAGIQEGLSSRPMFRLLRRTEPSLHGRRHRAAHRARVERPSPHPDQRRVRAWPCGRQRLLPDGDSGDSHGYGRVRPYEAGSSETARSRSRWPAMRRLLKFSTTMRPIMPGLSCSGSTSLQGDQDSERADAGALQLLVTASPSHATRTATRCIVLLR